MSKKKNKKANKTTKKTTTNKPKQKEQEIPILKFEKLDKVEEKTLSENSLNTKKKASVNETIQSFISILFTIIIFVALILIIYVIYNNYLKDDKKEVCKQEEVCKDLIPKDYHITSEMISNFIMNSRAVLYNFDNFNLKNITNQEMLKFATYFIWADNTDYLECAEDDDRCLVSKIEMDLTTLKEYFKNYLNIKDAKLEFTDEFHEDDKIRLYLENNKAVLTFNEFEYQSLKHHLVYYGVSEDKVTLVFALEKLVDNTNIYSYVGSKKVELKYQDKNFIIESITTNMQ